MQRVDGVFVVTQLRLPDCASVNGVYDAAMTQATAVAMEQYGWREAAGRLKHHGFQGGNLYHVRLYARG